MRIIFLITLIPLLISCQPRFEEQITVQEIEEHIAFLASEEMKGRYPGTPEDQQVCDYIAHEFKKTGLDLFHKNGIQSFDIVTELEMGPDNSFILDGAELSPGSDFIPLSFSASGEAKAEVIFAGYGFQVEDDPPAADWNDYKDLDVSGKWVMLLRGVPGPQDGSSPYVNYSEDRGKALLASDLGAVGVIFVSGISFDPKDQLEELKGKQHSLSIPVVHVGRESANRILELSGSFVLDSLDTKITKKLQNTSFPTGVDVDIRVDLHPKKMSTSNVIASMEGSDPALNKEYVIIGAHHDHLGMGGPGSSSRAQDTIAVHYGADDNASGVAGVLEISEFISGALPARSLLFATFGAEEMGLVGSKYLTENSPVDLDEVQAMINIDMIGRLNEDRQLQVGGVGTSPGFRELLDSINSSFDFNIKYSNEGFGPSDHAAFYAKDVPVLFISTGAHSDYHTPNDKLSAINLEGSQEVMLFTAEIALALANQHERIAFTEAGPKVRGSSRSRRGGITLGLMPDMNYDGSEGMPVMFVSEGRPAAVGGIQKNDVIVAIEGKHVGNVYDYMDRLASLKEGMDIVVRVNRDGDVLDLVIRI